MPKESTLFDFPSLLSVYRNELMGIAILGVMLIHFAIWGAIPYWAQNLSFSLGHLVYINGFLLLSGFGLYYSFSKNPNIKQFYEKRIHRVWIPFLIMAFPFFLINWLTGIDAFSTFLLKESALYFFFEGNDCGMWYISMILALYLLFPIIYKFLFTKESKIFLRLGVLYLFFLVGNYILCNSCPAYYEKVAIGFPKISIFLIGIFIGFLSKNPTYYSNRQKTILLILIPILLGFFYFLKKKDLFFLPYYEDFARIISIFLICIIFQMTHKAISQNILRILSWFGAYSLEIYVLHMLLLNLITNHAQQLYSNYQNLSILLLGFLPACLLCKPLHLIFSKIKF